MRIIIDSFTDDLKIGICNNIIPVFLTSIIIINNIPFACMISWNALLSVNHILLLHRRQTYWIQPCMCLPFTTVLNHRLRYHLGWEWQCSRVSWGGVRDRAEWGTRHSGRNYRHSNGHWPGWGPEWLLAICHLSGQLDGDLSHQQHHGERSPTTHKHRSNWKNAFNALSGDVCAFRGGSRQ